MLRGRAQLRGPFFGFGLDAELFWKAELGQRLEELGHAAAI